MVNEGHLMEEWANIIEESELSVAGVGRKYHIATASLNGWLHGDVKPRESSKKKMEEVLMKLKETKRIPYHPSWGYATQEQLDRLKESIPEQERDRIMDQIRKQTKLGGKID